MDAHTDADALSREWRYRLLGALESSAAPHVCTTRELTGLVRLERASATSLTVRSAVKGLVQARAITKVSNWLYLNRRSRPSAEVSELHNTFA